MTSAKFNARKAAAQEEMEFFDRLPKAVQAAIKASSTSVRSKTVWEALVRGVSEQTIINTIIAAAKQRTPTP